ncbi:hypothetical protein [Micromonospora sp. DT231]|uniref:hypothetical protein n=1 Tax=Micromonospora sp. DT231 TaxID=3416526 RepID=UPI003CF36BF7
MPTTSAGGPPAPIAPDRSTAGGGAGTPGAAVPRRDGDTPAPTVPPALATPTSNAWPPTSYLLVVVVLLAVLVVLFLRRRAPVPVAAPGPGPGADPAPDPGPLPDNVSRLPTSLNAIYEMGRQDERLEQERRQPT